MMKRISAYLALAAAVALVSVGSRPDPASGWVQKAFFCDPASTRCDADPDTDGILMMRWDRLADTVRGQSAPGIYPVTASNATGGQGLEMVYGKGFPLDPDDPASQFHNPVAYMRRDGRTAPVLTPGGSYLRQSQVDGPVVTYVIDSNQSAGFRCPELSITEQAIDPLNSSSGYRIILRSTTETSIVGPIRAALVAMSTWNEVQTQRSGDSPNGVGSLGTAGPTRVGFMFTHADMHPCDGDFAGQISSASQFDFNPAVTPNITVFDPSDLYWERLPLRGTDDYFVIGGAGGTSIYDIDHHDVDLGFALNPADGISQIVYDDSTGSIGQELNLPSGVMMVVLPAVDRDGVRNISGRARGMAHGVIRDADILVTATALSTIDSGFSAGMEGLLTQAMGLAMGLDHSPIFAAENEFMQPSMFPIREDFPRDQNSLIRILEADDEAAMLMMYPGTVLNDLQGNATATVASALEYNVFGWDFTRVGVRVGDVVVNETTGAQTDVTAVAATQLTLTADIFVAGDSFRIYGTLRNTNSARNGITGRTLGIIAGTADGVSTGVHLPHMRGLADAASTATSLVDPLNPFGSVAAGDLVINETTGEQATVTVAPLTPFSSITHTNLPSGWLAGDSYRIIGNNISGPGATGDLTSTTVNFFAVGVSPGDIVQNVTDGSSGTVLSAPAYGNTVQMVAGLSGGTSNVWNRLNQFRLVGPNITTTSGVSNELWDAAASFSASGVPMGATLRNVTQGLSCTVTAVGTSYVRCSGTVINFQPGDQYEITGDFPGGASTTVMIADSQSDFTSIAGLNIGDRLYNITDGSSGVIAVIASDRLTLAGPLTGGSSNVWQGGQRYAVIDDTPPFITSFPNTRFLFDLSKDFGLAGVAPGDAVHNLTDRSWGTVEYVSGSVIIVNGLVGGTVNQFINGDSYEIVDGVIGGTAAIAGCVRDANGDPVHGLSIVAVEIDGRNSDENSVYQPLAERDVVGSLTGAPVDPDSAVHRYCREYKEAVSGTNFGHPADPAVAARCHAIRTLAIDPLEIDLEFPTRTDGVHEFSDPDPTIASTGGSGCYLISGLPVNPGKGTAKYLVFAMDLDGSVGDVSQVVRSYLAKVSGRGYSSAVSLDSGDLYSGSPGGVFERVDTVDLGSPDRVELPCDGITGIATGGSTLTLIDTSRDFTTTGIADGMLVEKVGSTAVLGDSTIAVAGITQNVISFSGALSGGQSFAAGDYYRIASDAECPAGVTTGASRSIHNDVTRPGVVAVQAGKVSRGINITMPAARKLYQRLSDGALYIGQNNRPSLTGTPATLVRPGDAYEFRPTAVDQDADVLVFSITNRPAWATFDTATGALTGNPTQADSGNYAGIVISVSDGNNSPVSLAPFSIRVNSPPSISGAPTLFIGAGQPYSFTPDVLDPDGDPVVYSISNLPAWAAFDGAPCGAGELCSNPVTVTGSYANVIITVQDPYWPAVSLAAFTVTVNSPPTISGIPNPTAGVGVLYTFTPVTNDPDLDPLSFSVQNLPPWMTFNTVTGSITGTATAADAGTYTNIIISVTDNVYAPVSLAPFSISVNGPPAISGTPETRAYPGVLYSFTPAVTDPEADDLTYSVVNLPPWALFDPGNGNISGTPLQIDAGDYNGINITVTDGTNTPVSLGAFNIRVNSLPVPSFPAGMPVISVLQGVLAGGYSSTVTAFDPEGDVLAWTVNYLPPWASLNPVTGTVTNIAPTSGGSFVDIVLSVQDSAGPETVSLPPFTIIVNQPPVITAPLAPAASVNAGDPYPLFVPVVNDPDGIFSGLATGGSATTLEDTGIDFTALSPVLAAGDLVENLSVDPSASSVIDAGGIAATDLTLNPALSGGAVFTADDVYRVSAYTNAPGLTPLLYSVQNKPPWADFNEFTGALTGTPGEGDAGTYGNIIISVTDSNFAPVSLAPFSIHVNGSPVLTGTPVTELRPNQPFTFTPVANDPNGDALTFAITNKPEWAFFDETTGTLSGTPIVDDGGTYAGIEITATDSGGLTSAPLVFTLTVNSQPTGDILSDSHPLVSGMVMVTPGDPVWIIISAVDADGDALNVQVTTPGWAMLDPYPGNPTPGGVYLFAIDGTPDAGGADNGSYAIQVSISDGITPTVYLNPFTIIVNSAPYFNPFYTDITAIQAGDPYESFVVDLAEPYALDDDGDPLVYTVANLPAWASFDSSLGLIYAQGTATANVAGNYNGVVVTANDGNGGSVSKTLDIRVNGLPVISGNPPTLVTPGSLYSFTPTASDVNNDTLTFSIQNQPPWATFNAATGELRGIPSLADAGTYSNIIISVSDDGGVTTVDLPAFDILVNDPPVFTVPSPGVIALSVGDSLNFTATANDTDGDTLTWTITNQPPWSSFNGTTGALTSAPVTAAEIGNYLNVTITVTDGINAPVTMASFSIIVNGLATITNQPSLARPGFLFTFTPAISDPNGDTVVIDDLRNCPPWAVCNMLTGTISGTPTLADWDIGPDWNVEFDLDDGTDIATVIITVSLNNPPDITLQPNTVYSVDPGNNLAVAVNATDPDGDTLIWSIANQPSWTNFDTTTGALTSGPAPAAQIGNFTNIIISVSDGINPAVALGAFTVKIDGDPVIGGTPAGFVRAGSAYSFTPTASDPNGDALVFSVLNLPAWAAFDVNTGALTGNPTQADTGTYNNVEIRVSDDGGANWVSLAPFDIEVNGAPSFATASPVNVILSDAAGATVLFPANDATDPELDVLTYSFTGTLPAWAAFVPATGLLSGDPAGFGGTSSTFAICVSDGFGAPVCTSSFTVTVRAPLQISGTPDLLAVPGQLYSFQPAATGGDSSAYSFAIVDRPEWANFDTATGQLYGTPIAADRGDYLIEISVSDGVAGPVNLAPFTLRVNMPPILEAPAPVTQVATGDPYSFAPTAFDLDPADVLVFTVQNLPSWALFNPATGEITDDGGGATPEGKYEGIVIGVTDGNYNVTLPPFFIIVNSPPTISGAPVPIIPPNVLFSFTPASGDVDGDILAFSLQVREITGVRGGSSYTDPLVAPVADLLFSDDTVTWLAINSETGEISGTPVLNAFIDETGLYLIEINVTDGNFVVPITPIRLVVNAPPAVSFAAPAQVPTDGQPRQYPVTIDDPDNARSQLTMSLVNAPTFMTPLVQQTSGGFINFLVASNAPASEAGNTYSNIQIQVTDGYNTTLSAPFSVYVNGTPQLTFTSPWPDLACPRYVPTVVTYIINDLEGDGVTVTGQSYSHDFQNVSLPQMVTLNAGINTITCQPGGGHFGTGGYILTVTDGVNQFQISAALSVDLTRTPPTLSGIPPAIANTNEEYSFLPDTNAHPQNPNRPFTYDIVNKPSWAFFDYTTGRLYGVPGAVDYGVESNITISVSDGVNAPYVLGPFSIIVNTLPYIEGDPPGIANIAVPYSYTFFGWDIDPLDTLTFVGTDIPSWLSINPVTGELSGTPLVADRGTYVGIRIGVTDGIQTVYLDPFTIVVNTPPTISGTPDTLVSAGNPYNGGGGFTPVAVDPESPALDTLRFSITNKPSWAVFDTITGNLSGTPALADGGNYNDIVICVTDFNSLPVCLDPFSIRVNTPPILSGSPAAVIRPNEPFEFTPTAVDSSGDVLTFSIVNRPAWADFDTATGRLSGSPIVDDSGLYAGIEITADDGIVASAPLIFSIRVNAPPVISTTSVTQAPPGALYTFIANAVDLDGDALVITVDDQSGWLNAPVVTPPVDPGDPYEVLIDGTPTTADTGSYLFILYADDGFSPPVELRFLIVVNTPPVISGIPATVVQAGNAYPTFTPVASDPDGVPQGLLYRIDNQPPWAVFNTVTGALSGSTSVADIGRYENIVITVYDSNGGEASLPPFTIKVNGSPVLTATTPPIAVPGVNYSFTPTFSDPNHQPPANPETFTFIFSNPGCPSWAVCNPSTGTISGQPGLPDVGSYTFDIELSDGTVTTAPVSYTIEVNGPPAFNDTPADTQLIAGDFFEFPVALPLATDPEADFLAYSIVNRPIWMTFNAATGYLSGTPTPADSGIYTGIVISVADPYNPAVSLPAFTITVNAPPVISGTPALRAQPNQPYVFQPVTTDPENDVLTFAITNQPPWALFDSTTGRLSGTPSQLDSAVYGGIVIEVSDGLNPPVALPVFSIDVNSLPVLGTPVPPTQVSVGSNYGGAGGYTPSVFDFDDTAPFCWRIRNRPAWLTFGGGDFPACAPGTGNMTGTPVLADGGTYQFVEVSVSDDGGATYVSYPMFTIIVHTPPTVDAPAANPDVVNVGSPYTFTPTPTPGVVLYSITNRPAWASFDQLTGSITSNGNLTGADVGLYTGIVISVTDNVFPVVSTSPFSIKVNGAPVLSAGTVPRAVPDTAFSFTPVATDPNGDTLVFDFLGTCPTWALCNPNTGAITGTPSDADAGVYAIQIEADDGTSNPIPLVSNTLNFNIRVNSRPAFTAAGLTPDLSVPVGTPYEYPAGLVVTATDGDGDTLTYSVTNRPSWLSFSPSQGQLTGTPLAANAGFHTNITISVTDGFQTTALPAFTITVTGDPVISGTPATFAVPGQAYSFTPTGSSPVNNPVAYEITNKPAWATFNTATGALSGTPIVADATNSPYTNIIITIRDTMTLQSASLAPFDIVVNSPPVISGVPPAFAAVGSPFSFTPVATDPNGDAMQFSIEECPAWATCDGGVYPAFAAGTGEISGTPAAGDRGAYAGIRIWVRDAVLPNVPSSIGPFTIIVNTPPVPSFQPGSPQTVVPVSPLTPYSTTVSAVDADGETLIWSVQNLPAWAQFNQTTGALTNQPGRPLPSDGGLYENVIIAVTDGNFAPVELAPFSILVNRSPAISGTSPANIPTGVDYTFAPIASDPDAGDVLTFSVINNPGWMGIDPSTGVLSGTPSILDAGVASLNVTIEVTDGVNDPVQLVIPSLYVNGPPSFTTPCGDDVVLAGNLFTCNPGGTDTFEAGDIPLLVYTIQNRPPWAGFNPSTGVLTGTPGIADAGTYSGIVISVKDPLNLAVASAAFEVVVIRPNLPPVFDPATPGTVANPGILYSFDPVATDPDDDTLVYSIANKPAWAFFDPSTGRLWGTPIRADSTNSPYQNIVISVTDGINPPVSLPAFDIVVNSPPVISGGPATMVAINSDYHSPAGFTPDVYDLDGDALEFAVENCPYWATCDAGVYPAFLPATSGNISGVPVDGDQGSYVDIRIWVSDGVNQPVLLPAFTIIVNSRPTINFTGMVQASYVVAEDLTTDELANIQWTANDDDPGENANLLFVIQGQPDWLVFNSADGTVSVAPGGLTSADVGSYEIRVGVTDGNFDPVYYVNPLTIIVNGIPVISGVPAPRAGLDRTYSFTPTVVNAEAYDDLRFCIENLPAWAVFAGDTGAPCDGSTFNLTGNGSLGGSPLSSVPAHLANSPYTNIIIWISDGVNAPVALPSFDIEINQPPVVTGTPASAAVVGQLYSFSPTISDPETDTLTITMLNKPDWLTLNSSTGVLSGTPEATDIRLYNNIFYIVSDGTSSTTIGPFFINVLAAGSGGSGGGGTPGNPTKKGGGCAAGATDPGAAIGLVMALAGAAGRIRRRRKQA
ncbi:MAG: putative Ig domain-containing protein [Deltaproteobacteria bacterium]|nr:putative Ig domain-containing protein [Deltaproteobacteria bacterium]